MVDRHHPGKAPTALLHTLAGGACMTIDQLESALDLTRRQVSDAAAKLLRRDYLMRMGAGCYQLTASGLQAAASGEVIKAGPRGANGKVHIVRNTLRERAWRSMRIRRRFTVPDLVGDAATDADANPSSNLLRYLKALRAAGYIAELPRRAEGAALTSNGFKRWMLVRNTGPLAPIVISRRPAIHDRNTGEEVPCTTL